METGIQNRDVGGKIRSMVFTTVIHAFIPFFWIFFAAFIVPKFVAKFAEAGVEMPAITMVVISLSAFIIKYWFVYVFILAFLLVADGAVYSSLLRSRGKTSANLWSIVVMLVEGVFTVLCIIALWLPLVNIIKSIE
jgi:type II secretory pathway component PulF